MKFFELYKKEILSFFSCFLLFFIISCISCSFLIKDYKKSFISNNAYIINSIVEKHPELEQEIMATFHNSQPSYDLSLLKKYGFLNFESLSTIPFIQSMEIKTKSIIFWTAFFCFFLFLFSVLYFYIQKERRIQELHEYLFHVLENDYEVSFGDYREDGLSLFKTDLLKVTNKLRNISELSLQDKKNLERTLSDISHQLRTPLTSLTVINDVLSSHSMSIEEEQKFLLQQREQLERMEWLIVTLLKMSQIDSGTIVFQRRNESINRIIQEALKPSLIPMEIKEITYETTVSPDLEGFLDFRWTVEALVNLIKNATEHTDSKGFIKIVATDNPLYVEISIEDNGVGISKEDLPHIFERFYKGKSKSDSIGIGLNLSKSIIEKQDGTIHVESKIGEGTKFIIHFYKVTI